MPQTNSSSEIQLLTSVVPKFLLYAEVELGFSAQSLEKYKDCLRQIERMLGDQPIASYTEEDILTLKSKMIAKGNSVSRQVSILSALKRFLRFCQEYLKIQVLNPGLIMVPKRRRRDVVFLTPEEIQRFVEAISLTTLNGKDCVAGLRFRALVEVLLGSAMRIGELLSLDRRQVDFAKLEAKIIGKGNKERLVFFTARAVSWLERYLQCRKDDHPALFASRNGKTRLSRADIWRPFSRYRTLAGITKPVTPHIMRHTAATQLLFNGCPVGHIKEILGHERLETTCRYYLGLDRRAAKQAHQKYLIYSPSESSMQPAT